MRARTWLFIVAMLSAMPAAATPLVLDDSAQAFSLDGHLEAFFDETGKLTQEQIASKAYAQRFQPVARHFNGGFKRKGAWWLRVDVRSAAGGDWWLDFGANYVDELDVWWPERTADGVVLRHRALGAGRPASARDLPWPIPTLRLSSLPEREPGRIWMRLAGERSLSLRGSVWRLDALMGDYQAATIRISAAIGMTLMLTIVAFALGVSLPDRKFLWYASYLGLTALLMAMSEGHISLLLPDDPRLVLDINRVGVCLGLFTATMFAHSLLDLREQFPRTGAAFRLLAMFSLAAIGFALAGYYGVVAPLANLARLALMPVTIVLCAILVRRGQPGAWLNLIGYTAYGAMGGLIYAKNLNLLPLTYLTQYSYPIGMAAHMLAIFLGLGLRVRARERQALADSRAVGVRLEAAVAERTRELSHAQEALQAAMHEQRNFLSMVSHELRNPLSVIGVSAEMIADERLTGSVDDTRREAERITRAKQQMLGLIDTLLADDWLDSSAIQLSRADVDLGELLSDKAQEHGEASGRDIRFDARGDGLFVFADERLLHIVFDNLIENAIKYSPAGGAVEIEARREGKGVAVSVRDHGAGFAAADLGHVFERFYRSDVVRRKPGVGLGLYMVRRIAELHGGSARADNAEGGGAVLTVVLPVDG
jgi:two-component system, sensor histidine kinase LadS